MANCVAVIVLANHMEYVLLPFSRAWTSPISSPIFQFMCGVAALKNGYPRITLSSPILVMKKRCSWGFPWYFTMRCTPVVVLPAWLIILSTFHTCCGLARGCSFNCRLLTRCGCMKHSVAPVSRRAFRSAHFFFVWIKKPILIYLLCVAYKESVLQAQMRAVAFRLPENPHPLLILSWI